MNSKPITNADRLWHSIMQTAEIGALPGGGCCRLSLTDEDKTARDLFAKWAGEAGCSVKVDAFGNMYAIRPGVNADLAPVMIGSHLDTQPHGGRFDGVLGVMAGLEIIRALNDAKAETQAPIAVVNWTNEEGVRYKPGLTGSCGFVGTLKSGDQAAISSSDGNGYFDELRRIGYAGSYQPPMPLAYFEMHIEQGPVLEQANIALGIVEGVQGVRWYEVGVTGQDAHAGTTPMQNRKDSFLAAATIALAFREAALAVDPDIRVTFGHVEVTPNSTNTIPGHTMLVLDLRHSSEQVLDQMERLLDEKTVTTDANTGCCSRIRRIMNVRPVQFEEALKRDLETAAASLQLPFHRLPSGAMHDASNIAIMAPSAMLFIPSKDGISHNPLEWSEPSHVGVGCEVLCRAVLARANA